MEPFSIKPSQNYFTEITCLKSFPCHFQYKWSYSWTFINPPLGSFKYEACLQCSQISAGFAEFLCTHECYCIRYLYIYSVYCARISNKFKEQKRQWAIKVKIISCVVTKNTVFGHIPCCIPPPLDATPNFDGTRMWYVIFIHF